MYTFTISNAQLTQTILILTSSHCEQIEKKRKMLNKKHQMLVSYLLADCNEYISENIFEILENKDIPKDVIKYILLQYYFEDCYELEKLKYWRENYEIHDFFTSCGIRKQEDIYSIPNDVIKKHFPEYYIESDKIKYIYCGGKE